MRWDTENPAVYLSETMLLGASNLTNFFQSQPSTPQIVDERRGAHEDAPRTRPLWQRNATRSRTRTRSRVHLRGAYERGSHAPVGWARYSPEEHPLAPHNLAKRGYHTFNCLRVPFHVKKRYSFVRELGIGAYGCVALAYDTETEQEVAIKKVSNVFGREVLTRRALREVASLHYLSGCSNITHMLDFDTSFVEFSEIYLVLKASDADLSQIIRSNQTLTEAHVKYFLVQLLRAVHYMHTVHILHRDLKPGNLLVNADCSLQVCDFGMARAFTCKANDQGEINKIKSSGRRLSDISECSVSVSQANDAIDVPSGCVASSSPRTLEINNSRPPSPCGFSSRQVSSRLQSPQLKEDTNALNHIDTSGPLQFPGGPLTEYVATRWYRAPEVMLCFRGGYGPPMDVWSVGCIFGELLAGKPLFPGKDYINQLSLIHEVLGSPPQQVMDQIGSQKAKEYMQSLPSCPQKPWSSVFPDAPEPALDLLSKMLQWDPSKRISAHEALAHPWLSRYCRASFAVRFPEPFSQFDEVEEIRTPSEFKEALEHQSDPKTQIRAHYPAGSFVAEHEAGSPGPSTLESSKHKWMSDMRPSSAQSASTGSKSLAMHPYDWTPPSSFDSEPSIPDPSERKDEVFKRAATPLLPEHCSTGQDTDKLAADQPELLGQKKVQRKSSSEFSILNRARALMNWT